MFHAYAYVLQSIMGNYTYLMSHYPGKKCSKGKILNNTYYDKFRDSDSGRPEIMWVSRGTALSSYRTGLTVNFTLSSLRFVSCGERGIGAYAFKELLVAYDLATWILVLFAVAILQFVFRMLCLPVLSSKHFLSVIKVILEQGDPF